jgi:flagellar motor switch protein FliN
MEALSSVHAEKIVEACRQGAAEVAAAFGRSLGIEGKLTVTVGAPESSPALELAPLLAGPGLLIALPVGESGALVALSERSKLIPAWCAQPDATGESKLATLAQELGMLLLPEEFMPEDFKAGRVANLAQAVRQAGLPETVSSIPLEITADDGRQGKAILIWPARTPMAAIAAGEEKSKPAAPTASVAPSAPAASAASAAPATKAAAPQRRHASLNDLPQYAKSLLHIQVPVVVTLAQNRQPLGRILELGPGSIIHFEKSCEETLDLEVGGRRIAAGEAVKVGDKFGLRITSISLPDERFHKV